MNAATELRHLTVRETAELLAVSPKTIRRHIASGELDAVRVGSARSVRIPAGAVGQLLRAVHADHDRHEGDDAR